MLAVALFVPGVLAGSIAATLPAPRPDRGGVRWATWRLDAAGGLLVLRRLLPAAPGGKNPVPAAVAHVPPALAA